MDTRFGEFKSSGKRYLARAAVLSLASGAVLAAVFFVANNQPWGYIAPPALSGTNLEHNDVVAYTPWFEEGSFRGGLLALPVNANGTVTSLAPNWRASQMLDAQDYSNGRRIVTTNGSGSGKPFLYNRLTNDQKSQIGSAVVLNYVRGDRTNEAENQMRVRTGVFGDIIHSGPVYVGKPLAGYDFGDYLEFANDNASRAGRVYVGANDGMLHAFDASDGSEVFAYVPSMVIGNLPKLAVQPYNHQYFVDGILTVEDAYFRNSWHSVLVGGLGAGGKGYYGLDVTDPSAASETQAASKILWEFHSTSTGADNLGYSYSRPSIVRLDDSDQWGAVVGNGYLSSSGVASLYVIDIESGDLIKELVVAGGEDNGLSSPTVVDTDGDGIVDAAYAGDLNGNLWKFELGPSDPDSWSVAYGGLPLFETATGQAITTAPEVGRHPESGIMVYIGTGRLLSTLDGVNTTTQAVYGLWDNGAPIDPTKLVQQQLKSAVHSSGASTRTATDNGLDWSAHSGWVTPTEIAGATVLDQGERVIQDLLLRDGRVMFMSVNPTIATGENWFIQLNALTGGAPRKTIIDVNEDLILNVADNVDGNDDGTVGDIREDRVVGEYQRFGLASRPVVGVIGGSTNTALINHLTAISPNPVFDADDPGLLGGHFDLDTSSQTYAFDNGTTDGHVHQWDDKHDLTTINYMDLPDGGGNPLSEINDASHGIDRSSVFLLTVANTDLSRGGVLEINSASIAVFDYHDLMERYLKGNLREQDGPFPLLKLDPPTATETAAGVTQLTSLKLSFDAYAILSGDLVPTVTKCVRDNNAGERGEYRNGALLLQALDASDVSDGFEMDGAAHQYVAGSAAVHSQLSYATDGLFWESTVFWHWDGPCYADSDWQQQYDDCITNGGGQCLASSDDKKDKAKKKKGKGKDDPYDDPDDDSPPPSGEPPEVSDDPGHNVSNTTISGGSDTGRLFWKELVPED